MSVWEDSPSSLYGSRSGYTQSSTNDQDFIKQASNFGWTDMGNGNWRKGQYTMTTEELTPQLRRWSSIEGASNPGSYNAGVDYSAAVSPYLSQASAAASAGPAAVNTSNEYENRLMALLNNPDSISSTGAYKFAYDQGQQALERSAAAKGMTGSGNVLAELVKYGQGMASQQYNTEADRLAGLAGGQKNYILGLKNAANSEFGTKSQNYLGMGNLALNAAKSKSDDYWNGQQLATQNSLGSGYGKQSVW